MKVRFIFGLVVLLIFGVMSYESRRIPQPDQDDQVLKIPYDVQNVLGAKASDTENSIRVPIFLYHYVEYVQDKGDTIRKSLDIVPDTLRSQIETLKNAGYTFVTPTDISDAIKNKKKLPLKIVALTFDDGYKDFYTDVFPILKEENVKAIAYIVPDFLNRPNFMFTFQLQEIAKSPLVEIGAHTMDHVWLKGINKKTAEYEIGQSRIELQKLTGLPINSFAYPYGAFDQQAIQIVKDAGFTNAVSTVPGIVDNADTRYFLYRLRPGYRTGQELLTYLSKDTFKPW